MHPPWNWRSTPFCGALAGELADQLSCRPHRSGTVAWGPGAGNALHPATSAGQRSACINPHESHMFLQDGGVKHVDGDSATHAGHCPGPPCVHPVLGRHTIAPDGSKCTQLAKIVVPIDVYIRSDHKYGDMDLEKIQHRAY